MSRKPSFLQPVPASPITTAWREAGKEPAIDEVLADPLVHLVMRRDGVSPCELRRVIVRARTDLRRRLCCSFAA